MDKVLFQTSDISAYAGQGQKLTGTLEVGEFSLGPMNYAIEKGISYEVTLSNIGDAIVVNGYASADVDGTCVRCLEPAKVNVESDVEGYFALSEDSDVTGMEEDEYEYVPEDGVIDLAPEIYSAIIVEIPTIFLCKDDCKGLCPTCGANLNYETCDCANKIDEDNPFSVLKDLFKDENMNNEADN
ncbi:MAG: YceD family protein [Coriobacteriales bacterium]|jgi:uncharacterized protein